MEFKLTIFQRKSHNNLYVAMAFYYFNRKFNIAVLKIED
ncbi:hypothetical protein J2Y60_001221 [Arcicella sp. BE140]|nr:hypothetical protein [Arcicella sp. BE51]MDR6811032.1 hypothetical protein [Arcicella sp. BE140]MDR6822382.1 hypothetical protein [Arcicella sp. BE139]